MMRPVLYLSLAVAAVAALQTPEPPVSTRRAFVGRIPLVAGIAGGVTIDNLLGGGASSSGRHDPSCRCQSCGSRHVAPANAYERRDVGGTDASAMTKAMNDQAYETNNRLERAGMKLETSAEQSSALTAELSKYDYSPSSSSTSKKQAKKSSAKSASPAN